MDKETIEKGIEGVVIKPYIQTQNLFSDLRGDTFEVHRSDFDEKIILPQACVVTYTRFGVIRGPDEHFFTNDYFAFVGPGNFTFYLWENRGNKKSSEFYHKRMDILVGQDNPVNILVPPGVVHGFQSISYQGGWCINLPDKLYRGRLKKSLDVDEIKYGANPNSIFRID
jgi:dTDP-4-dehydrorhamnose 3,5-epimerase